MGRTAEQRIRMGASLWLPSVESILNHGPERNDRFVLRSNSSPTLLSRPLRVHSSTATDHDGAQNQLASTTLAVAWHARTRFIQSFCLVSIAQATGVIYKNSGHLTAAIAHYDKALKVNANFDIANSNMAMAYTGIWHTFL
jgi:hypothetical protein